MAPNHFEPKGWQLTPEQQAIQLARKSHLIIEANAGAAKTTTLALRLAQALARGAEPQRILVLTYTEAAVLAFRAALLRIGVAPAIAKRVQVCTFDAYCAQRLAVLEGTHTPALTTAESLRPYVLQAIDRVRHHFDERYPEAISLHDRGEASVEGLLTDFTYLKGTMLLQQEAWDRPITPRLADELGQSYTVLKVLSTYEHLRRGGHPDHPVFRAPHDATYDLARLLHDPDAWLGDEHGQGHPLDAGIQLLLLDEMHDTNRAMFTVLGELMRRNRAGFVGVGDRDQVIHAQAGADARFMGELFDQEVAPATRLPLSVTWRFGPALAQAASRITRAAKPYLTACAHPTEVVVVQSAHERDTRQHIMRLVQERVGLSQQATLSDMAILLRHPHQSMALENNFLDHGIDYRTAGFDTYLLRPEVLFVRGLYACTHNCLEAIERPETRQAVLRALLTFSGSFISVDEGQRPESPEAQAELTEQAIAELTQFPEHARHFLEHQILRNAPPSIRSHLEDALDVLERNGAQTLHRTFLPALQPTKLASRVLVRHQDIAQVQANLAGLMTAAQDFDDLHAFFRAMNEREIRRHAMKPQHCVCLSTIEAAKGLEFDHVMVPGLNRGEFALGGDTSDNRNLFYVAITRARRRLTLLCEQGRASAYLTDAGLL